MFWIAAADIAGSRLEGAIFSGATLSDATVTGSHFEVNRGIRIGERATDFDLFGEGNGFTDDTVLTAAVIQWLLEGDSAENRFRQWIRAYPNRGYGKFTELWANFDHVEPQAVGNGAAMRAVPFGYVFETAAEAREAARATGRTTHIADSALAGAEAVAVAVFLARNGATPNELRRIIMSEIDYDLTETTDQIRERRRPFSSDCRDTIPPAIIAACESSSFEDAVRRAISLGGDTDTMAVIAGALAAEWHGFDEKLVAKTKKFLPAEIIGLFERFNARYLV